MRRNVFRMKEEGYLEELESMDPESSQVALILQLMIYGYQ